MKRLFLQLWAKLFCSLLAVAIVGALVVVPRVKQQIASPIARSLTPLVRAVSEAVVQERALGRDLPGAVARASDRFAVAAAVIARAEVRELDAAQLASLDRGQPVVRVAVPNPLGYERLAGTDQVLAVALPGPPQSLGIRRGIVIGLLLVAGLSLGVAFIAWPLARRLGELSRAARSLGAGDLGARAKVGPRDAVGHLEATFNGMAEEIQRLITAHGELLRMVSHELRTPIQRLHVALEMAAGAPDDAARERRLARMATDLEELDALIEELLVYSRLDKRFALERQPVCVAELLRDAVDALAELRGDVSIEVSPAVPAVMTLLAEPRLARRAVENLVQNAMRHAARRVVLRAERAGGRVRIDVDDDGPGVPEAERAQIFTPFRRLANHPEGARDGHGLGLAIVQRIADSHAGQVAASSSPLGGARFQLWLPGAD